MEKRTNLLFEFLKLLLFLLAVVFDFALGFLAGVFDTLGAVCVLRGAQSLGVIFGGKRQTGGKGSVHSLAEERKQAVSDNVVSQGESRGGSMVMRRRENGTFLDDLLRFPFRLFAMVMLVAREKLRDGLWDMVGRQAYIEQGLDTLGVLSRLQTKGY